jgi:5-methylcytosine-specific restriction protein A
MASGFVTREPFEDEDFRAGSKSSKIYYVGIRFDSMIDPDLEEGSNLNIEKLPAGELSAFFRKVKNAAAGGILIPPAAALEIEERWRSLLASSGLQADFRADEVEQVNPFFEGATRVVLVNAFERNRYARDACLKHHRCICAICAFDFEKFYGELGRDFIHVHHVVPLADIRSEYLINPITDLIPVCPNCHAMLHRNKKTMSAEELRERIVESRTLNRPNSG